MMQNLGYRRSVQKCAQNAGSNVLKDPFQCCKRDLDQLVYQYALFGKHVGLQYGPEHLFIEDGRQKMAFNNYEV